MHACDYVAIGRKKNESVIVLYFSHMEGSLMGVSLSACPFLLSHGRRNISLRLDGCIDGWGHDYLLAITLAHTLVLSLARHVSVQHACLPATTTT